MEHTHKHTAALLSAQAEWDIATNAYSRHAGAMEWEAFLLAKQKVQRLRERHQASHDLTYRKLSPTTQTILRLLQQQPDMSYAHMMHHGTLTKDQVRHGLLWLIKNGMIEKIKAGQYRILHCNN